MRKAQVPINCAFLYKMLGENCEICVAHRIAKDIPQISNRNSEFRIFLCQVSDDELKERLEQLEGRRLADESSRGDLSLQMVIEECNEQYKAVEITTEWMKVCFAFRPR